MPGLAEWESILFVNTVLAGVQQPLGSSEVVGAHGVHAQLGSISGFADVPSSQ